MRVLIDEGRDPRRRLSARFMACRLIAAIPVGRDPVRRFLLRSRKNSCRKENMDEGIEDVSRLDCKNMARSLERLPSVDGRVPVSPHILRSIRIKEAIEP